MRADKFFAEKFGSRTKSAEELLAGRILREGKALKPKDEVCANDEFTYLLPEKRFVSNGGYKLDKALVEFEYSCAGKVFADIGASTGGFTDCLLQNDAEKVFAIDVGECLLDKRLSDDTRVIPIENTNARYLTKEAFSCELDCVVADVSFISLRLILPVIADILPDRKDSLVLIKPQFECEKKGIGKSGIVKHSEHKKIVEKVLNCAESACLLPKKITNAPIKKGKNIEYVLWLVKDETLQIDSKTKQINKNILQVVDKILKNEADNK